MLGNDEKGGLGDGKDDQASEYSPVAVAGGHTFTTLTAGGMHTCGVDTAGKAWCWGSDGNGKLGDGDDGQEREPSPVAVAGEHRFSTLTASNMHTCGVDTTGKAWCWGWDTDGAAGDGDDGQGNEYSPVAVAGGHTFAALTTGDLHTCGLDTAGVAWCWGYDGQGQVGDGDDGQGDEYSPVAVAGGTRSWSLTAGYRHTCGVDPAGAAWGWGACSFGSLSFSPVAVAVGHIHDPDRLKQPHVRGRHRREGVVLGLEQFGRPRGRQGRVDRPNPGGGGRGAHFHVPDRRGHAHVRGRQCREGVVLGLRRPRAGW
ncbi:MAG: hypothetical protein IPG68_13930 [Micrococcales bacterium]|nr:hypothetical protein [Micrococcales bacterium]